MPDEPPSGEGALEPLATEPHRRYNPLIDEWVLVSAGRGRRPWLGAEEPEVDGTGASAKLLGLLPGRFIAQHEDGATAKVGN